VVGVEQPGGEGGIEPCVFCDIVARRADAHIVWADDHVVAFLDRSPLFPGHTLVVPVDHVVQLTDLPGSAVGPFFDRVQRLARAIPIAVGKPGTFVAMNNIVSQSVAHLHTHVVPRRKGDGLRGFFWPRQKYAPGEAAAVAARIADVLANSGVADERSGR
jgi:histidine triad (HIT) family protein